MDRLDYENLLNNLQSYLEANGIDTRKLFRCINPNHTDNNASMQYFKDNHCYCFGCGQSYNLIDCISIMEKIDKKEAFKRAIEMYCYNKSYDKIQRVDKPKTEKKQASEKDYTKAYSVWQNNFNKNEQAQEYFKSRGFDMKLAKKFKIGFNTFNFNDVEFNALIIPTSKNYFTARNIDDNSDFRYYKPTGNHTDIFNKEAIYSNSMYCVITEGEFDALSFESAGAKAIALSGVTHLNKFIQLDIPKDKTYILALDNDNAGKTTKEKLIQYFNDNGISFVEFFNPYKDANDFFVNDEKYFSDIILEVIDKITENIEKSKNYEEVM